MALKLLSMSQKSSLPQAASSVSQVLKRDNVVLNFEGSNATLLQHRRRMWRILVTPDGGWRTLRTKPKGCCTRHQQSWNDDFQPLLFRNRSNDCTIPADTGSPLMIEHASKKSVPPSVGADVSGIEALLNRNLPEVFGEGDAARRRAAIQELYTGDCVLYVPPGTFVGHDALDKFAGDLRATHPHYVYTPHGAPQVLHNSGRLAWGSGPKGETPVYTGVDFIIARDGKIAALYVYLDSPPA
jgi:hypothetical protein